METSSRAGWFAVMLGILLPGLGHVYIRQFGKGFVLNILGWGLRDPLIFSYEQIRAKSSVSH